MGTSKDNLIQRTTELEGNLMEEQAKSIEYENRYNQLLEENKDFEEQLRLLKLETKRILAESNYSLKESKNQSTYIHETCHLHCSDGEMHIQYGDYENENWIVYNTDQLFKDLPFIINQVIKENKKMQSYYLNNIVTELKEIDYTILQDEDATNSKDI